MSDPWLLFAAYHLGVLPDGEYRFQNLHQVAESVALDVPELQMLLCREGLDAESVLASGFDLAGAQIEVLAAASSEERLATARRLFESYRNQPARTRDWERELAEDAAANERTFPKK